MPAPVCSRISRTPRAVCVPRSRRRPGDKIAEPSPVPPATYLCLPNLILRSLDDRTKESSPKLPARAASPGSNVAQRGMLIGKGMDYNRLHQRKAGECSKRVFVTNDCRGVTSIERNKFAPGPVASFGAPSHHSRAAESVRWTNPQGLALWESTISRSRSATSTRRWFSLATVSDRRAKISPALPPCPFLPTPFLRSRF
jgi:hypothetical protein